MTPHALLLLALLAAPATGCLGLDDPGLARSQAGDAQRPAEAAGPASQPVDVRIQHPLTEPPGSRQIEVPEGVGRARIQMSLEPGESGQACLGLGARIELVGPDGQRFAWGSGESIAAGAGQHPCAQRRWQPSSLSAGTWTVSFEGRGHGVLALELTAGAGS